MFFRSNKGYTSFMKTPMGSQFPSCSQHLWEALKKKSTHNKELNEESDLCIGKLHSCFDNSYYKKFAGKAAWISTFPISKLAS